MKKKFTFLIALLSLFYANVLQAQTYCTPAYSSGCTYDDDIKDFILQGDIAPGINNLNTPCPIGGYADYTTMAATLTAGQTYSGNVTTNYPSPSENVQIWIDYNNDGIFQTTESVATLADLSNTSTGAFSFTVPIAQPAGSYRMRVRLAYSTIANQIDPCTMVSYGEAHDYTVNIIASVGCAGTPNAGTLPATLGVCASNPFSFSPTGPTLAGGLELKWQQRVPASTGTWTDVAGATTYGFNSTGISVPTDYRFISKCTASGLSDTTTVLAVTINPANQCYCTPQYTYGCNSNDDINSVILQGDLAPGINNLNTPCPSNGYADYTAMSATLSAGQTYSGNVTTNYSSASENVRIWIDYNNDGFFQASETIDSIANLSNSGTGAFSFTVPVTQAGGTYRMRVRLVYNTTPDQIDPCIMEFYGEAHDYTVNIIAAVSCTGTPSAGTLPATMAVCANIPFNVSPGSPTLAGGLDMKWQQRVPASTGAWINIPGATSTSFNSTGITVPTDYRFISKCIASGLSDTTTVLAVSINPANQCYCIPTTPAGGDDYINSFTTTGASQNISKLNTGFTAPGYADYTATDTLKVLQGETVSFNTEMGTIWNDFGERIWIDYDMDGAFNSTNEKVFETGSSSMGSPISGSFTIPLTATPGYTRMRVRIASYDYPDACNPLPSFTTGEAEDYIIQIVQLPSCSTVTIPANVAIVSNRDTVCVSQDVTLSLTTTMPIVSGFTYQYQSAASASGPWTNIGTPQATNSITVPNVSTATFFRLQVYCGATVTSTSSNVLPIVVSNPTVATTTPGERCGPGTVTLGATAATGLNLNWYANATGGASLATGAAFVTPSLTQTDTFYVGAGIVGSSVLLAVGAGASTSVSGNSEYSGVSPFAYHYGNYKHQILFTASELNALGMSPGEITSIAFDIVTAGSPAATFNNFTVGIKQTSATFMVDNFETSLTTVFTGNYVPSVGLNTFAFSTPFLWDGVSNIIIQTCYNNNNSGVVNSSAEVKYDMTSFVSHTVYRADGNQNTICDQAAGNFGNDGPTSSKRPKVVFEYNGGCESPRTAVVATIKSAPTVNLGNDTTICSGASLTLNAGNPGNTFLWNNNTTSQTLNVTTPGSYSVKVTGTNSCSKSDTIQITAGIMPVNTLPAVTDLCAGDTATLDAGNTGSTYLWDNAATTKTIKVTTAGVRDVVITSPDGCSLTSSTMVTLRTVPVVNLGYDTAICDGDQITLNAGNAGMTYLWNTGATTQSINITNTGTYSARVTSSYNCVGRDTVQVSTLPQPTVDAFNATDLSAEELGKFKFTAVNAQNVTAYDWDFGDGSNHSTDVSPTHVYTSTGIFTVTLKVSNGCGEKSVSFTLNVDVVGIEGLIKGDVNISLYPNPTNREVIIENKSNDLQIQEISIINVLGAEVYNAKTSQNKIQKINVSGLASGLYNARIFTNKGLVIKKFEIIK